MLKPEQAKAELAKWRLTDDVDRIRDGIATLPEHRQAPARHMLGIDDGENEQLEWRERQQRRKAATLAWGRTTPEDRAGLFRLISPALAPHLEQAWQLVTTTPYTRGYERKAFRAPRQPELCQEKQMYWLENMADVAKRYPPEILTPRWFATWAAHLREGYTGSEAEIGVFLAAVLNQETAEADEVFEILRQSLTNQHEIGRTGRHVYSALLLSNRRAGWELMEKTLLAAQRQEGLRQAILEAVDETHPEAFRRLLRIILDEDLVRFAAVVRAFDVWVGQPWSAAAAGMVKKGLEQIVEFLENPAAREKAYAGKDPQATYYALWAAATEDAVATLPVAEKLLAHKLVEVRCAAATHLRNLDLEAACIVSSIALRDDDVRVAVAGLTSGEYEEEFDGQEIPEQDGRFEDVERLLERFPEKTLKLKPIIWPWTEREVKRTEIAEHLPSLLGKRPPLRLLPHLPKIEGYRRGYAVETIIKVQPWDEATRRAVVEFAGEASTDVRDKALAALADVELRPDEVEIFCGYLTRKASELRRGILAIFLKLPDPAALAASDKLLAAKDANQRLAGLELLRHLADSGRAVDECRGRAADYLKARPKRSKEEQTQLDEIVREKVKLPTLDDALGLLNSAERTPPTSPVRRQVPMITAAAVACLTSLDELVEKYKTEEIEVESYRGRERQLLGNLSGWQFPRPEINKPTEKQLARWPLADVWRTWYAERGAALRDADGFELIRAEAWLAVCNDYSPEKWPKWAHSKPHREGFAAAVCGGQKTLRLRHGDLVERLLDWLQYLHPQDASDYLLDAVESTYAAVPAEEQELLRTSDASKVSKHRSWNDDEATDDWRESEPGKLWAEQFARNLGGLRRKLTDAEVVRKWKLDAWFDEPFRGAPTALRCGPIAESLRGRSRKTGRHRRSSAGPSRPRGLQRRRL
ncbi:MAG: hypothetical protein QM775_36905 [Pirellulales bacterium]